VLLFALLTLNAKYNEVIVSPVLAAAISDLQAAALFISFGTTLVTTVLIAYRIYSVSKQQLPSSRRFNNIIDIVIQSGTIYAFSQLAYAIAFVVPGSNGFDTRIIAFQNYIIAINVATTVRILFGLYLTCLTNKKPRGFYQPLWLLGCPCYLLKPHTLQLQYIYPASNSTQVPPTRRLMWRQCRSL
jgi:hypothetical protein